MQHWDELNINNFSGPLDLLWNMVKEKKIDIQDINLIEIINQYLEYINNHQKLDIEIASEYLVMASQMIELKSRKLLPTEAEFEDEEFQFEDLLDQITQYGQIKSLTDFFYNKQEEYLSGFSKPKTKTSFIQVVSERSEESMVDPLEMDLDDFADIFKRILQEAEEFSFDLADENFDIDDYYTPIQQEIISPQLIAKSIVEIMKTNKYKEWRLEEVITQYEFTLINLISTFLAVLDLVRNQIATISQKNETLEFCFTKEVLNDQSLLKRIEEVKEYE